MAGSHRVSSRREGPAIIGSTTSRKGKKAAEAPVDGLFDGSPLPLLVLEGDASIARANPAFLALVPGARPGADFLELHGDPTRARMQLATLATSKAERLVLDVADEPRARVEYHLFALPDGRIGVIGRVLGAADAGGGAAPLASKDTTAVDSVTGLSTRERVMDRLAAEWSRAAQRDDPLACLLVRVDGLDRVRREADGEVADALLRAVAGRLKTLLREQDLVGRYDEERFLIVAQRCDRAGAQLLAQRIAREIAMTRFAVRGGLHRVSVRVGCGWRQGEQDEKPEAILVAADLDMRHEA